MSEPRPPRTPLKVAVMTFGAIILVGLVILAVTGGLSSGGLGPYDRGERYGRAITPFALIGAVIGFVVQKRRLTRVS